MITFFKRRPKNRLRVAAAVRAAQLSIMDLMQPLLAKAKREGRSLVLSCQGRTFTPQQLEAEWVKGRYIMGPKWWRLSRLPEE